MRNRLLDVNNKGWRLAVKTRAETRNCELGNENREAGAESRELRPETYT
jgi:hypothetical protein